MWSNVREYVMFLAGGNRVITADRFKGLTVVATEDLTVATSFHKLIQWAANETVSVNELVYCLRSTKCRIVK